MKIKKSHLKELIRQAIKEAVTEEKTYKAKKKDGKVVVFKNKDNWKKALKTGDYEKIDSKKKDKLPFKPDSKISSDPFDGDVGGPSYANVPKGVKTSKDAIGVKKAQDLAKSAIPNNTDSAAKDIGYDNTEDLVMNGSADEIGELVDHDDVWESLPKDLHRPINNALDFIRDNEMGMIGDPVGDELLHDYREEILDMIQNPDGYGKEKETGDRLKQMDAPDDYEDSMDDLMKQMGDDEEISGMGAAEKANKKMEIDVLNKRAEKGKGDLIDTEQIGMVSWVNGDPDEDSFIATNEDGEDIEIDYDEIVRFHNDNDSVMKNLNLESIQKSKQRRYTVKEVRMWMKKLEENRYKKVYNSDARRVSWMCNHIGENVINMPKSMRKKWSKAQYGRERYLAKEFLKSQKRQIKEQILRKVIRGIIKEQLNKGKLTEAPKPIHHSDAEYIQVWKNHIPKTQKLLKKLVAKGQVEIDTKPIKVSGYIKVTTTKKLYNKILELLMKANIKIRG